MRTLIVILAFLVGLLQLRANDDSNAWITTSENGAVQLQWKPDTSARRTYAIYRKLESDRTYPATPLVRIGTPTCEEIVQRLTTDSAMRKLLHGLSAPPPGSSELQIQSSICDLITGDVHRAQYRRLGYLCGRNYRLAKICGTLYEDRTARAGNTYEYEIRAVIAPNNEVVIHASNRLKILSGGATNFPGFEGLRAYAGDGMVELVWLTRPGQIPVITQVERDTIKQGWAGAIVREIVPHRSDSSITGEPLAEGMVSFIDQGGTQPPISGQTYKYRLRQFAANGRGGLYHPMYTELIVKPLDKTPPAVVQRINGVSSKTTGAITLTWNRAYYDANGIRETMGTYSIYRVPNDAVTFTPNDLIATVPDPGARSTDHILSYTDRQVVVDPCMSKFYTYLVAATDSAGNTGAQSAAIVVPVHDVIPPVRVKGFRVEGAEGAIILSWQPNEDCDVYRYNIYRALCDYGTWKPCDEDSDSLTAGRYRQEREKSSGANRSRPNANSNSTSQGNCGGPFTLIASVDHSEAETLMRFEDKTLPEDSPLCYAYVVAAQDSAGNQSVRFPVPDPIQDVVLCARLIDHKAPTPGSIARFSYDNNKIVVRARTVPVQDLMAFHLYRTTDTAAQYTFLQSKILDASSMQFIKSDRKYAPSASTGNICNLIPLGAMTSGMSVEFVDDSAVPYVKYWYKIATVDRDGNESAFSETSEVGTFTYGRQDLDSCVVTVGPDASGNRLKVQISTSAPATSIVSYAVFRSTSIDGQFRQLGVESATPEIIDSSVLRGVTYWYRAIVFFADQRYTDLSAPVSGTLP